MQNKNFNHSATFLPNLKPQFDFNDTGTHQRRYVDEQWLPSSTDHFFYIAVFDDRSDFFFAGSY